MNRKNRKTALRSAAVTLVIFFCAALFGIGVCKAFCGTRQTAYGDYKKAVKIDREGVRILDFEIF